MRGIKAEGGWGVVFAEQCDFHHSTDNQRNVRLWDRQDTRIIGRMVEEVHAYGSLAGLMLAHNGFATANLIGRETPLAPSLIPSFGIMPGHARKLDKQDLKTLRAVHRNAALLARDTGFDIVNVYAGHNLALPMHFLARRYNDRTDEYGGSIENRARFLRELLEETKEAIGDTCAVGARFSVDEMMGPAGITSEVEGREVVEMLQNCPTSGDVTVAPWSWDSITSRFAEEGLAGRQGCLREAGDNQTGGRRRPLHQPRYHGLADQARYPRYHRRGATHDRRSLPPEEDRGGAARGHPRVHRLQRLHHEQLHDHADPLYAEPDDGRGVAARLASRAHPTCRHRRPHPDRGRGPCWTRSYPGAGPTGLSGDACRGTRRAWWPGDPRKPPARPCSLGAGSGLAPGPDRQAAQCRGLSGSAMDVEAVLETDATLVGIASVRRGGATVWDVIAGAPSPGRRPNTC